MTNCSGVQSSNPITDQLTANILSVGYASIAIFGIPFNTIIILLFIAFNTLQTFSNVLLISLAIGDILTCLVLCPLTIAELQGSNNCTLLVAANFLTALMGISGLSLTSIAYHRYIVIVYDVSYKEILTNVKKTVLLLLPWMAPFLLFACKKIYSPLSDYAVILVIVGCATVIGYSSCKMTKRLNISSKIPDSQGTRKKIRNRKAVLLINWIFLFSVISSIAMCLNRMLALIHNIQYWHWYSQYGKLFLSIGRFILASTSVINPFIYFWKHKQFRKVIGHLFRKHRVTVNPSPLICTD